MAHIEKQFPIPPLVLVFKDHFVPHLEDIQSVINTVLFSFTLFLVIIPIKS